MIGKYKSVPDQLMLKNLSDILIKSNDLDELDFLTIIIRNPKTLNNTDVYKKARYAIKKIRKSKPLIAFEALINLSLFSQVNIENLLEEENFISNSSSYYELAGFAYVLSQYNFRENSNRLINKSLSLVESNSEHKHLYYCAKILMKNGQISLAKDLCKKAFEARNHILYYYFTYLICANLEISNNHQLGLMSNNTNLIFQGEHRHFCDFDYVLRF